MSGEAVLVFADDGVLRSAVSEDVVGRSAIAHLIDHGKPGEIYNATDDEPVTTGKIALAHLNEFADYYTRLERGDMNGVSEGVLEALAVATRHDDGRPIWIQFPFSPFGIEALTPFVVKGDWPSLAADPSRKDSPRVGKFTHPSAAPDNHMLTVWSPGPVNHNGHHPPVVERLFNGLQFAGVRRRIPGLKALHRGPSLDQRAVDREVVRR